MYTARYFCPILTKFSFHRHILRKVADIRIQENPSNGSQADTCRRDWQTRKHDESMKFSGRQNSIKVSRADSRLRSRVSETNSISIIRAMRSDRYYRPDDGDGVCLRNVGLRSHRPDTGDGVCLRNVGLRSHRPDNGDELRLRNVGPYKSLAAAVCPRKLHSWRSLLAFFTNMRMCTRSVIAYLKLEFISTLVRFLYHQLLWKVKRMANDVTRNGLSFCSPV
jgi:hypothetical protein